jgi:pyruvyltransferase
MAMSALETSVRIVTRGGRQLYSRLRVSVGSPPPVAYWWRARPNFGDSMNPVLIQRITGRRPVHGHDLGAGYEGPVYSVIGSVLHHAIASRVVVWGSGFISESSTFARRPHEVRAVRGPLTRELVLGQGVPCPPVYGDPALLFSRYYRPPTEKTAQLGVVPHFVDKASAAVQRLAGMPGVRIIDPQRDADAVVADICQCEVIASTSLHGLIMAVAYGIPCVWVETSQSVLGNGFKFRDFFLSIGAPAPDPLQLTESTPAAQLVDSARRFPIDLDLDRLLVSCPFRPEAH